MRMIGDIQTKERLHCLLCGDTGQLVYKGLQDRLGLPGEWDYLQCSICGLIWLNPSPIQEDIPRLYATYYTHRRRAIASNQLVVVARKVALSNQLTKRLLVALLRCGLLDPLAAPSFWSHLWLTASQPGKLLDVGCGNGDFLSIMQALGWKVWGVEPDQKAAAVAQSDLGLHVKVATLEEAKFATNTFDVVRMNHVIEHLPDPIRTLHECARVLRPGGRLLISTPNAESLGHRIFRKDWLHLDPARHLWLFSARSLRVAVERAGLRIEALHTTARGAGFTWLTSWLIRREGILSPGWRECLPLAVRIEGLAFQWLEFVLSVSGKLGEDLEVVAIKETG